VAARVEAAELASAVGRRVDEQQALVERAAASRNALVAAQADRRSTIAAIEGDRDAVLAEIAELEKQSATLAATIRASQPVATEVVVPVSGGGLLAWPVSGPVTSGFGMRWGRLHEGIDIAVPSGSPVGASAAGTVIYAAWLGGYGNLVVVDHGGGLATAYAHNSSYAVGVGQTVETGTVIAYSGNTGNSSGPHVHFEVRVNGTAVDPLGYL
jgi:murein DD-endopeptidase MepM/ murein hydrolase activator NlpD